MTNTQYTALQRTIMGLFLTLAVGLAALVLLGVYALASLVF